MGKKNKTTTQELTPAGKWLYRIFIVSIVGFLLLRIEYLGMLSAATAALLLIDRWIGRRAISRIAIEVRPSGHRNRVDDFEPFTVQLSNRNRFLPIFRPSVTICENETNRQQTYVFNKMIQATDRLDFQVHAILSHRGLRYFKVLEIAYRYPFGFVTTKRIETTQTEPFIVWPRKLPIELEPMLPKNSAPLPLSTNSRNTKKVDRDISRIRNYQPGDPRRSINWRLSAKSDELVILDGHVEDLEKFDFVLDLSNQLWKSTFHFERMLCYLSVILPAMYDKGILRSVILGDKRFRIHDRRHLNAVMDAASVSSATDTTPIIPNRYKRGRICLMPKSGNSVQLIRFERSQEVAV